MSPEEELKMDLKTYIQLIFLCDVNIFFACCGIFLNSLVILSFIKSSQLRKKLCYLVIMILSCVDLLAVTTNHPTVVIFSISWLTKKYDSFTTLRGCPPKSGPIVFVSEIKFLLNFPFKRT